VTKPDEGQINEHRRMRTRLTGRRP
jgi:hypothetical protein